VNKKITNFLFCLALLTITGCPDDAPYSKTADPAKQTMTRDKITLRVVIRWPGDDFASRQDLETRDQIQRQLLERKVGKVLRVGTGMGWMDIIVAVKDEAAARSSIAEIMRAIAPTRKYSLEQGQ
jgi:hypothetical protein